MRLSASSAFTPFLSLLNPASVTSPPQPLLRAPLRTAERRRRHGFLPVRPRRLVLYRRRTATPIPRVLAPLPESAPSPSVRHPRLRKSRIHLGAWQPRRTTNGCARLAWMWVKVTTKTGYLLVPFSPATLAGLFVCQNLGAGGRGQQTMQPVVAGPSNALTMTSLYSKSPIATGVPMPSATATGCTQIGSAQRTRCRPEHRRVRRRIRTRSHPTCRCAIPKRSSDPRGARPLLGTCLPTAHPIHKR